MVKTTKIKKTCEYRKLERLSYEDLNKVFKPNPDPEAVNYAYHKIADTINEMEYATRANYSGGSAIAIPLITGEWPRDKNGFIDAEEVEDCFLDNEGDDNSPVTCDGAGGYAHFETLDEALAAASARCIDGEGMWIDSDALSGFSGPGTVFGSAVQNFWRANTVSARVQAINRVIQATHGRGKLDYIFVEGGTKTLDRLHLQNPSLVREFHE